MEGQYDKSTPQPSHAIVDDKSSLFGCLFVFPFNRKVWTMTGPGDTHVVVQCSSLYAYIYYIYTCIGIGYTAMTQ